MPQSLRHWLLIGPGLGWLAVFLVVPCLLVFANAFFERGVYGGIVYQPTLQNLVRAAEPLYLSIVADSARIATTATLIALLAGYPAAYAIAKAPANRQTALLVIVMLPFWSNYLIRTYAWIVLLNREGLVNRALVGGGVIGEPLTLLYNEFAVVVGLVYNYLPFVVLAVYSSLQRLDQSLVEASRDLGAGAAQTFLRITLPLTLPGIAAGAVFVFVLSIGNFVTPDLLGGGRMQMVGNLIYDQFLTARDWPFGAALAAILIALMMILLFAQAVASRRASGLGAELWPPAIVSFPSPPPPPHEGCKILQTSPSGGGRRAEPAGWGLSCGKATPMPERSPWLNLHLAAVIAFLYLPIAVLVALSFNRAGLPTAWTGFSTDWYVRLVHNPKILGALWNSLIVAAASTVLSTALGTLLAVGVEQRRPGPLVEATMFAPMIIPDIVLAIALLSFYTALGMTLGLYSIALSHAVFNIAFVAAVVRARLKRFDWSLTEASRDLGASEVQTFLRVTLPLIAPSVIAGALLAFTLSLDEFIIAYFTSGAGPSSTTLPMQIYAMVRFGVTPEINALAAILMLVSFTLVLAAQRSNRGEHVIR